MATGSRTLTLKLLADIDNFQKNLITARIECMEEINLMQPTAAIYASINA